MILLSKPVMLASLYYKVICMHARHPLSSANSFSNIWKRTRRLPQGIGRSPGLKMNKVLINSYVAFHKVSAIW